VFLLALDTCDIRGSVAILHDAEMLHVVVHETADDYSGWLLPAVNLALETAGVSPGYVDVYAVAAGPGSFTGVRVALTTAKAWAEVYDRPIAVVSRLEAIAVQASGNEPYVAAFADARRNQLFGAVYSRQGSTVHLVDDEMVIAPEKFIVCAAEAASGAPIRWISTEPQCLTETRTWSARRSLDETAQTASPVLAPVIGQLGYQLALKNQLTDALALDANYVRRSDAEIFWKDRR